MNTKFTSGPWVVNNGSESRFLQGKITTKSKGCDVVICDTPSPYFGEDISRANAHLIACAPDMYEMLEECKSILEGNTYFVKAEKIEQLLKRARGE